MNGKGDRQRKKTVSQETWDKNWERIFGKKIKEVNHERDEKGRDKHKG